MEIKDAVADVHLKQSGEELRNKAGDRASHCCVARNEHEIEQHVDQNPTDRCEILLSQIATGGEQSSKNTGQAYGRKTVHDDRKYEIPLRVTGIDLFKEMLGVKNRTDGNDERRCEQQREGELHNIFNVLAELEHAAEEGNKLDGKQGGDLVGRIQQTKTLHVNPALAFAFIAANDLFDHDGVEAVVECHQQHQDGKRQTLFQDHPVKGHIPVETEPVCFIQHHDKADEPGEHVTEGLSIHKFQTADLDPEIVVEDKDHKQDLNDPVEH